MLIAAGACSNEKARQYPFRGTVVNVDLNAKVASIKNEDIPGWMKPMTMEYPIDNGDDYKSLRPGDNILATINVTSDRYWLTNIRKLPGR